MIFAKGLRYRQFLWVKMNPQTGVFVDKLDSRLSLCYSVSESLNC
jgi:hypothetical protein